MTAPPYMPLYIGDYMRDTLDFGALEHGAYLLLLMHAWTHGGSIPKGDKDLARIACLPLYLWKRRKLKLLAKFHDAGANFQHRRVARELANALKKQEVARNKSERCSPNIIKKDSSSRRERYSAADQQFLELCNGAGVDPRTIPDGPRKRHGNSRRNREERT